MRILRIDGGHRLAGETRVGCAKNATLPILAAALLADDPVTILKAPDIADVEIMRDILKMLGCETVRLGDGVMVDPTGLKDSALPDQLAKKLRSSVFLLGPMLGKLRRATVTYPGGCDIGLRPIDLHLKGLESLGVRISEEGGLIVCDGSAMHGGVVHFDYPSVGATENVMMAAVLTPGRTVIHNAAREPEILDLQRFINEMGGNVSGGGLQTIVIDGVKRLRGAAYRPMPDRIVAGTLLAAAAITGGEITVLDAMASDMMAIISKLREMGCRIQESDGRIDLIAPRRLRAFKHLETQPYPGFPTDMQAQMLALATVAEGSSVILEKVFENRFTHVPDFTRMGADILVNDRVAVIRGVSRLHGARVTSRDLRGGAALVLAGLAAQGITDVEQVALIDRGYERLEEQLSGLGARITRLEA
ncbi:MAG: UDP-N-acetylglucosamine 1-carboxyvinyltransferase [Firmicutes bacterium]|nr:UDP-N-acetylglucosamine 1-carboxyvinyltransferase [Bacillota bacterium]